MSDVAVPDFFRRLWRYRRPHRLGRKSTLDVEAVVSAAVRLADEGGLEAATLPKVAEELGVTAMSLYRHVGSKHELLQLMMDAASGPGCTRVDGPSGWRDGLKRWAVDLWSLYQVRPSIPGLPSTPSRPLQDPHQVAWLERGFEQLASTELDWNEKLTALTLLSGFVRQAALLQEELMEGRGAGQAQSDERARVRGGTAASGRRGTVSADLGDAGVRGLLERTARGRRSRPGLPRRTRTHSGRTRGAGGPRPQSGE